MTLVAVENLQKSYSSSGAGTEMIVNVPSFNMGEQDQLALQGSSGSGKTTFLHLLAGVLLPDAGHITFSGQGLHLMNESQRDQLRLNQIGYVFQSFNLLNGFSCLENLLLTMELKGKADLSMPIFTSGSRRVIELIIYRISSRLVSNNAWRWQGHW